MAADGQVRERFQRLLDDDRRAGRVRSLESYRRLFHGHEDVIEREYERLVEATPAPPKPVDPPSSTDSLLERLPRADNGLRPDGELARGGMGAIRRVHDEALHRDLAMKVMLPEREAEALYVHRFLEEAQITAQLDHPGVVPVHQLGRDPDGRLYFTMKLVRGRTLSRIFELVRARRENWTNTRAIELFIRICETLAFAHQKGVVHRDLKPANIMVGNYGELYVMDWGLAKVVGATPPPVDEHTPTPEPRSVVKTVRSGDSSTSSSPTETVAGDVVGTPAYMPLEQAMGASLDARSDVYAVGAMLYELFAGHAPYGDKPRSAADVLVAVVAGPPTPLRRLKPRLPGEILAICEKAMARDPADRYATAGELAQELRNFIEGRVVRAYRTGAFVELKKWVSRNKALAGAIGAAVALLAAGLVANRGLYHEAVREGERAQREAYRAGIAAAASEIGTFDFEAAAARLDALPERFRGWEWRYLAGRLQPSFADLPFRPEGFDARTGRVLGHDRHGRHYAYDPGAGTVEEVAAPGAAAPVPDEPDDAAKALAARLMEHVVGMQDVSASPDRTQVAFTRDHTVTLHDVATGQPVAPLRSLGSNITSRVWSPDGRHLALGTWDAAVVVLDAATGGVYRTFHGCGTYVHAVAFSADGRLLVTAAGDGGQVWEVEADPDPCVLRGHHYYVYPVGFSPDGRRIVSGGWDGHIGETGSLRIWDAATGRQVAQAYSVKTVWRAAYLPDGNLLVSLRSPEGLILLDGDTLGKIRGLGGFDRFAVSPEGTRAVCSDGKECRVLDLATGSVLATLPSTGAVGGLAWGPGRIVTGTELPDRGWQLTLWNPTTFARERAIADPGPVLAVALAPQGPRIAVTGWTDGSVRVYDGDSGEELAALPGHTELLCVRFSPDGRRLLAGGRDAHIHIWDAETYDEIVQLRGHTAYVYSLDFSPDAETLASGSGDGTVRLWETQPLRVRQRAIAERERLVDELRPEVMRLFAELGDGKAVAARLRADLTGRRREVALQLALAESVARRG